MEITRDNLDEEFAKLLKRMSETLMKREQTGFLGYEKGKPIVRSGMQRENHRNGYYERDFLSSLGLVEDLNVPRDRLGEFYPKLLNALELRSGKVEDLIVALYSKGMSNRDISDVIGSIYEDSISPQTVTNLTQAVQEEREAWERRPLNSRYTAIFIDALFVKVRRDVVASDAVYLIGGVDEEGHKEILGMYLGTTESAVIWEEHLQDLKDRGVSEVLVFISDGLTGLKEAILRKFPKAAVQRCVVHQLRGTLNNVRPKHKEEMADDLRTIYQVGSLESAKRNLLAVRNKWQKFYPRLFQSWEDNLEDLMAYLTFPKFLRKYFYTTNWLERINKELRKVTKTKNSFPTENAVKNLLYFKIRELNMKYEEKRIPGFDKYKPELEAMWKVRYSFSTFSR
jgi:transposase-like protein